MTSLETPAPDEPRRCSGTSKRTGEQCGQFVKPGETVCKWHGGGAPQVKRKATERRQRDEAVQAAATYGLSREVDPHTALLEELHRTAGHVAWLGDVVANLEKGDLWGRVGGAAGGIPEAQRSIWVQLYQDERTHLMRIAKVCVDVGIEERRVQLAEAAGRQLASVIRAIVGRLGVADHPELPTVLREELGRMTLEAGDGSMGT